jgi:MFS superfamily sulfate permease-like transporter
MIMQGLSAKMLSRDFTASIVVFLVAMPLCMGIALASGVPPERGLITGMIGGIIVGALAGSPLQVSGPAAGLAVIVFEIVRDQGLSALGPILILAGLIQVVAGIFRLGGMFRAISPAVVHGMLAGIGVLIVAGQFHVLFDAKPLAGGLDNLAAMPARLMGLTPGSGAGTMPAFLIGLITIAAMLGWEKFRPGALRLVPGALIGVLAATIVAIFAAMDVARVQVPESIASAISLPDAGILSLLIDPTVILTALAIAFIASAETLLSAAAVDRMHDGVRTDYNKELRAQGVGNLLCGAVGAIPMTGVIVRSSANVQAGAVSRLSAMLHGVWILGFVALLPWLLREIPMAALAGILVVTGWRLVSVGHVRHLFHLYGPLPLLVWAGTLVMVVATDLLTGVLVGIGLSLVELVPHIRRLRLKIDEPADRDVPELALDGAATFLTLPKLVARLDAVPATGHMRLNLDRLVHIDHTCAEMLHDWIKRRRDMGGPVEVTTVEGRHERLVGVKA